MGIPAVRINVCENICYDKVVIYPLAEQRTMGVPNFFEDGQICFRDSFGKLLLSDDDMVGDITLRMMKPRKEFVKASRITVTWDQITYAPAWIIPDNMYDQCSVPRIYPTKKQFSFIAENYLHLTKDDRVAIVELIR